MEMTFYNTSDQLTLSADGLTYGYLGRASNASIVQPGTDPVLSKAGYSTYTIYWPGDILVVLPVKVNGPTALKDVSQSNGTWTITVFKATNTGNSLGLENQEYTEVYVFGAPYPGVDSICMLYDGNGNPSGDLSRPPLTVKGILSLDGNPANTTWGASGIPSPGIIGSPLGGRATSNKFGTTQWNNRTYGYGWMLDGNGNIMRALINDTYSRDDGGISTYDYPLPVQAIVTSVAGL
jgi:hypothetical protein